MAVSRDVTDRRLGENTAHLLTPIEVLHFPLAGSTPSAPRGRAHPGNEGRPVTVILESQLRAWLDGFPRAVPSTTATSKEK